MIERSYSTRVQHALAALPPAAFAAALDQLRFIKGEDDQLTLVADAWMVVAGGRDATAAARWLRSARKRELKDMRRAGTAADVSKISDVWLVAEQDPIAAAMGAEAAMEYQAAAVAAGWATAAAPATIGQEPALPVVLAAQASHRGLRTVQTRMRGICRAEQGGQGVLPGVPAAREVYAARALGVQV